VGRSDGWTDLADNYQMAWQFDHAPDGNVALMGELDLQGQNTFTLGLALGDSLNNAVTTLFQALAIPFEAQKERYIEQWHRACRKILPLDPVSGEVGNLYHGSVSVLLAHEDKSYPGALIASLSIPWGEAKGMKTRADTTWSGPATWPTAPPGCSPPDMSKRRCGR
jgi:glucoamylase